MNPRERATGTASPSDDELPRTEPGIKGWCHAWKQAVTTGDTCLYDDCGCDPCWESCVDFERREEAGS